MLTSLYITTDDLLPLEWSKVVIMRITMMTKNPGEKPVRDPPLIRLYNILHVGETKYDKLPCVSLQRLLLCHHPHTFWNNFPNCEKAFRVVLPLCNKKDKVEAARVYTIPAYM